MERLRFSLLQPIKIENYDIILGDYLDLSCPAGYSKLGLKYIARLYYGSLRPRACRPCGLALISLISQTGSTFVGEIPNQSKTAGPAAPRSETPIVKSCNVL